MILPIVKAFVIAFGALFPVINPLGSALLFLGVVGAAPPETIRHIARKVAVDTILFLLLIELAGATLLNFFGISLPVVQFAGGFVLAAMGWRLLNDGDKDADAHEAATQTNSGMPLEEKIFYPLTFPLTADPACIVITVTLSAHVSRREVTQNILAHVGIALAIVGLGIAVLLCYVSAPQITKKISPQTVHGILRVIAFVLLCIGVQIAWNGLDALVKGLSK